MEKLVLKMVHIGKKIKFSKWKHTFYLSPELFLNIWSDVQHIEKKNIHVKNWHKHKKENNCVLIYYYFYLKYETNKHKHVTIAAFGMKQTTVFSGV